MVENRSAAESQINFINTLKIDIQKLIISLGTGALVFSVSFQQIIPDSQRKLSNDFLIWFWLPLIVSVVSGVFALVSGAMWYGHKLMTDQSKEEKYHTKSFRFKTKLWNYSGNIFDFINIAFFVIAMVLAAIFAFRIFGAQMVPIQS